MLPSASTLSSKSHNTEGNLPITRLTFPETLSSYTHVAVAVPFNVSESEDINVFPLNLPSFSLLNIHLMSPSL